MKWEISMNTVYCWHCVFGIGLSCDSNSDCVAGSCIGGGCGKLWVVYKTFYDF